MATNTSRLGLLKKDTTTDGNDTFNIKTMLNDNWDKIDAKVATLGPDGKVPTAQLPALADASTTQKGVVQLEDSITSTSTSKAATPNSVKQANDALTSHKADTVSHVTQTNKDNWNGKYTKPTAGIPEADLDQATKDKLNKQSITGNAGTATKLQTPRKINGTNFDGSSDIVFGRLEPIAITVNGTDMNTFINPGMYYCAVNATAATLLNCPTASAFSLLVEKHAGIKQTITEYVNDGTARTFTRNLYQTAWGPWTQILLTKDMTTHETDIAPHQYGNKFEWRYNATANSLDLVVL